MILDRIPRRVRLILWIAGTLLILFSITGFFILPPILKAQLVKRLSAELGRPLELETVRVNPYALSVTLDNLEVGEKDGGSVFFGWHRLHVKFDALSSLFGDWVLGGIALDGFHAHVVINQDGTFNFSDLLAKLGAPPAPSAAAAPAGAPRPIRIASLKVTDARIEFADNSRDKPFRTVVGPLSFALTEFHTAGDRRAPYHIEAVTESGERFAWTGTLSADPLSSAGEFSIENIDLPKYAPYIDRASNADITSGRLTMRGRYEARLDSRNRVLKLADGGLSLRDLRVARRGSSRAVVELAALEVSGVNGDGVALKAEAGRMALSGGHLAVRREKDGTINLLALLPSSGAPAGGVPAAAVPSAPPIDLKVGEFVLKDFKIDITDLAAPRPVRLGLSDLQCSMKNLTLAEGASMPLQLSLNWAPQGTVKIEGSVSIRPALKAGLKTEVSGLAILPLSPYLEQFANARITEGAVSTSNQVQFAMEGGQPAATFEGDMRVDKFGLVDGARLEDLAGFSSLTLRGLRISTAPQLDISLSGVAVAVPYARVVVNKDQSLNLAVVAKQSAPTPEKAKAGAAVPLPRIEIANVTITDGDFSFADRSVEPEVKMAVNQFGGTIAGLSSRSLGRADVDLKAMVDGVGPVAIAGKLDPLSENKFVDLNVDVKSVDLLPLSPYSGKFAGYELSRGKLFLAIKARVADRKVEMANVVKLDQFTFGAATNSAEATHLPVRLGVALLKDLDGRIVIDVPVEGSLDDPEFSIGKVVWRVIGNLLTKAAVSPFSLVGSMFGGGGEELSYQEFAPGAMVPLPAEEPKLEVLAKAMTQRPGLNLDIEGSFDSAADTYALKQQKLADLILRRIGEARRTADPDIAPPEQLAITPEECGAMLKKLFDEKFPPGTEFGTPLPRPPAVTPPPAKPAPGLIKRVVKTITFQSARDRRAAEEAQAKAAEGFKDATAAAIAGGLPPDVMTARLADTMEVTDDDLRALAMARAAQIRDYMVATGKIAQERLFLAKMSPAAPASQNKGPRVFFELQ